MLLTVEIRSDLLFTANFLHKLCKCVLTVFLEINKFSEMISKGNPKHKDFKTSISLNVKVLIEQLLSFKKT